MSTPPPFHFHPGAAPLLISFPHVGAHVPRALAQRLTPKAREVRGTQRLTATLLIAACACP
jgi:N-formylglutamate deformylase